MDPLLNEEIDQVLSNNFQVRNGFLVHTNHISSTSSLVSPLSASNTSSIQTINFQSPKKLVLFNPEQGTSTSSSNNSWKSRSLPGNRLF